MFIYLNQLIEELNLIINELIMTLNFQDLFDLLGTFAFALSGILLASGKQIDWFGAYVIGLVTAIGGGTLRDLLLDVTPVWLTDPKYIITTACALLIVIVFKEKVFRLSKTLLLFDAIGLGLFTITGLTKAIDLGFPIWASIIMGTITGAVGGVIRDIILNQIPHLFRKDIYALVSLFGGILYVLLIQIEFMLPFSGLISALAIIILRVLAVKYHIQLPKLHLNSKS